MQKLKVRVGDGLEGNAAFMEFLEALPTTFDHRGEEIHHARNILKTIDAAGLGLPDGIDKVMVKRYRGLFWFQKLDYTYMRTPKCRRAFDNTAELRRRGFDAARELGVVEVWSHGLFQYGFFVSAVGQGLRLDDLVIKLRNEGKTETVKTLISQYATLVKRLHERGVLYWDMNCGNVLCRQEKPEGDWHFTLIDTNRIRFFAPDTPLPLDTVIGDLILMNPKMGTVEMFQTEYLRQRGLYTEDNARRVREEQERRYGPIHV